MISSRNFNEKILSAKRRSVIENENFYKDLGQLIRAARESSNITQESLASKVSLTRTSITNIEKGRQQLLVHTLVQISMALKVEPESLLPKTQFLRETLDGILSQESQDVKDWVRNAASAKE